MPVVFGGGRMGGCCLGYGGSKGHAGLGMGDMNPWSELGQGPH